MNDNPIVFALANPIPEITPEEAYKGGAKIVGTGSGLWPNQINNVLAFPGLFRGALDVRAKDINNEMMMAASIGIAESIPADQLKEDYIIPYANDIKAHQSVAKHVREAAIRTNSNRK